MLNGYLKARLKKIDELTNNFSFFNEMKVSETILEYCKDRGDFFFSYSGLFWENEGSDGGEWTEYKNNKEVVANIDDFFTEFLKLNHPEIPHKWYTDYCKTRLDLLKDREKIMTEI